MIDGWVLNSAHRRRLGVLGGVLLPLVAHAADIRDPDVACQVLAEQRLPTRGGYQQILGGTYQCASRVRDLPVGGAVRHSVRFRASGDAQAVDTLTVQLNVNSLENVQRAHAALYQYAESLLAKGLDAPTPDGMRDAVMSAVNGSWTVDGATVEVRKAQIRGLTYELLVQVRPH